MKRCLSVEGSNIFLQQEICDVSSEAESEPVSWSCRSDAFSLWLLWKTVGMQALEERVDKTLTNAK